MAISTMLSILGQGFVITLEIFFLTLIGSLPLGIVVALARMSRIKPISWITKFYISIMRGTPLMLPMFAIYFAPYYVFGIELSPGSKFTATIVAFVVNYAAYFAASSPFRAASTRRPRSWAIRAPKRS